VKLELERRTLGLRSPLPASYGVLHERELLIVKITDSDGSFGYGEAAPLPDYDGPDIDQVLRALDAYREVLEHAEGLNGVQTVDACRRVADMPVAYAAIDLALWDKAGRYSEKSVAQLLVEEPANSVPVNATLTSLDRAGIAEQATMAVREGFGCLKVKVGVGDDAGRVAAVRAAAGPQALIRLDANGAWTPDQAVRAIASLSPAGLELFEEPTHASAWRCVWRSMRPRLSRGLWGPVSRTPCA
jgi:L-alanine-DL-glutamate epimerase-like enolase superfamily enzyme